MSRIKHPVRALREPFGTAGLVVAVIALVLALTGAAFAAKGALTGKQKKEVEKIAKKFAKAGPQGPAGAPGSAGTQGAPGTAGANGKDGANGVSAEATSFSGAKGPCTAGGVEVKSAKPAAFVCNGTNGTTGFTETLPQGSTETGVWSVEGERQEISPGVSVGQPYYSTPISFPIPLTAAPTPHFIPPGTPAAGEGELTEHSNIVTNLSTSSGTFSVEAVISGAGIPEGTTIKKCLNAGNEPLLTCEGANGLELSQEATASGTGVALHTSPPAGCAGNVSSPEAEEGNLCVFARETENSFPAFGVVSFRDPASGAFNSAGPFGTLLLRGVQNEGTLMRSNGTWAVTGTE